MKHLITFALVAVLFAVVGAMGGPGNKDCWENRPTVKPKDCCRGLATIPDSELDECKKAYPEEADNDDDDDDDDDDDEADVDKKHKKHHHHHRHHCVMECYFNKTGIFKDRQVVKPTALKIFSGTDSVFENLISSGIDACVADEQAMSKKFQEMMAAKGKESKGRPDGKHCPPKAMFIAKCVEMKVYQNCPADRKVSSTECAKLGEFLDKCAPGKMKGESN